MKSITEQLNKQADWGSKESNFSTDVALAEKGLSSAEFRKQLKGRVIMPDDPEYDQARTIFYGGVDRRPAVIVRVADAEDVAKAISIARESGMELAVRSGGHSAAGHGLSEGGIVLDLR